MTNEYENHNIGYNGNFRGSGQSDLLSTGLKQIGHHVYTKDTYVVESVFNTSAT
ncbi:hypothetical protein SCA04_16460 [Staphylococcus carnosus]|nr:hypothetical protein SCA04_16460 [Staphylococcus carnosus]GEP78798.1 hypothetical protein SCA05_05910 [Staphylococcus carnosus]